MQRILYIAAVVIGSLFFLIGVALFLFFAFSADVPRLNELTDVVFAANYGQFIAGFIGTTINVVVAFLLFATLLSQSNTNAKIAFESNFYKMLDYHFQHIQSLSVKHVRSTDEQYETVTGKRAFVVFKLQLDRLLHAVRHIGVELELDLNDDQVIDIACIAFYYGLDAEQRDFLVSTLARYPRAAEIVDHLIAGKDRRLESTREHIGRANQTNLSSYFRNMYHLIKYVDKQRLIPRAEKIRYINILRAQLSNNELWLLYFNVVSRFGRKWIENDFVVKYRLIKNMPHGFCRPFDHAGTFPMPYEEDETGAPR